MGSSTGDAGARQDVIVIPVKGRPLFPGLYKAVNVTDRSTIAAIKEALQRNRPYVSVFMAKDDEFDGQRIRSLSDIHQVGVHSQIYNVLAGANDAMTLLLYPHSRVKIRELKIQKNDAETKKPISGEDASEQEAVGPATAYLDTLEDGPFDPDAPSYRSRVKELLDTLNEIAKLNPLVRDQMPNFISAIGSMTDLYRVPGKVADFAAAMSEGSPQDLQQVLECLDIQKRLDKSILLLKQELLNAELQNQVSKDLDRQINERDREYFLKERLKNIQAELGVETNSREKLVEKYKKRVASLFMPEGAKMVFDEVRNSCE